MSNTQTPPNKGSKSPAEGRPQKGAIGSSHKEEALGNSSDYAILLRLWKYIYPYRAAFFFCLFLLPVLAGLSLVQPLLLQIAIDDYFVPGNFEGIYWVVALFGVAVIGHTAMQYVQYYVMQQAGQNALHDLRQALFDHVQGLGVGYFKKTPLGRLMARMTTDVESLEEVLSSGMITMIGDIITLFAIVVILIYKSWSLALVSFTVLPFLVILTAIFRYLLRKAYRQIRVRIARLYAHLQESIAGINIIRIFTRENISAQEYHAINKEYRDANIRSVRYDAMLYAVVEAVGSVAVGLIIWWGSGQVLEGVVTLGVLVAFIEYMQKFFVPIRNLAQKYNLLQSALASSERIFQLLDTDDGLEVKPDALPLPQGDLTIEFRNVWFAYQDEQWVLQDISFVVTPGDKIALVGHTGAGKTTIISLMLRLYDVTRGQILLNGVDIREYSLPDYRRKFAAVLQDAFLFQGTIRQNLLLNDESIPVEIMQQAAKTVRAHDLIMRHKDGYDQPIGERGGNLSAGEKQLMTFARALIREPEILILDEATANLDTDTEQRIQEAVEILLQRQTSVVIAHRLSTIQRSTGIIVLHRGKILETGTHDELLARGGHYRTLYELQFAHSVDSSTNRLQTMPAI